MRIYLNKEKTVDLLYIDHYMNVKQFCMVHFSEAEKWKGLKDCSEPVKFSVCFVWNYASHCTHATCDCISFISCFDEMTEIQFYFWKWKLIREKMMPFLNNPDSIYDWPILFIPRLKLYFCIELPKLHGFESDGQPLSKRYSLVIFEKQ